jgi:hypothetical protein
VHGRLRAALTAAVAATVLAACMGDGVATQQPVPPGATQRLGASPGVVGTEAPGSPDATGAALPVPAAGTWARLVVDGPAPAAREDHTWTVAEDGRTAYLFGGRDGGKQFDDLWSFDLQAGTWKKVPFGGDAPAARFGHEGAWIPGRGLAIWAGQAGSTFFDDLWLYEPASGAWRLLPADGQAPVARYGSCSGVGPDGRLWISHGFTEDGVRFADSRAYDLDAARWSDQAPAGDGPVQRCLHVCWWTSDGRLALYGGQTTGVPALGDLWFLAPGTSGAASNAWSPAPEQELAARQLPAVARRAGVTVVVGGRGENRKPLGDAWVVADESPSFQRLEISGDAPAARSGAAMVYDAPGDRMLLFGGLGEDAFDDLWVLTFS